MYLRCESEVVWNPEDNREHEVGPSISVCNFDGLLDFYIAGMKARIKRGLKEEAELACLRDDTIDLYRASKFLDQEVRTFVGSILKTLEKQVDTETAREHFSTFRSMGGGD